jgi:hypothetical protein
MRALALLPLLLLAGCGLSPALIGAGLGFGAGVLRLDTALIDLVTARETRPPDCSAVVPPPCVVMP